jgi:hypothetical protein
VLRMCEETPSLWGRAELQVWRGNCKMKNARQGFYAPGGRPRVHTHHQHCQDCGLGPLGHPGFLGSIASRVWVEGCSDIAGESDQDSGISQQITAMGRP